MSTHPITLLLADSQIDEVTALKLSIESQIGNCRVVTTDNGTHALEIAEDHQSYAVISDLRLNDMSGLKLLLRLKAICPTIKTVLMSDCTTDSVRKMCLDSGVDFYMEKPLDAVLLSTMLGLSLQDTDSIFRGTLDNLNIPDALQLVIGRTSLMLMRIDGPSGQGVIEIADGQVIHARLNGRIGEQAFFELVCWTEGQFEIIDVECSEERTIGVPLPQLLMKAAVFQSEQPSSAQQSENDASDRGKQQAFFDSEATAPTVNTVWENMSHYKQQETTWDHPIVSNKPTPHMGPIPSINAYRSARTASGKPLQFKKAPARVRYSIPDAVDLISKPVASPSHRRRFRPVELPSARRMLVASLCACCILVGGVRYFGLLETNYGRDLGASAADLVEQIAPEAGVLDQLGLLWEQSIKTSRTVVIDNDSIQAHLKNDERSVPVEPESSAKLWPSYTLSVQNHNTLLAAPNLIGVSGELYDNLRLQANPWVEVQNAAGDRIGGMATRLEGSSEDLILPNSLARVLSLSTETVNTVRMRQVAWQDKTKRSLTFVESKDLPGRFCEYWYAVGVSLPALQKAGLTPGETAIIRGPSGMLPVRVQLVDRGNDELIWLSKPVCDAAGVVPGSDNVKLFPNG